MSMVKPRAFRTACRLSKNKDRHFVLFRGLSNVPALYSLDIAFLFEIHENKVHHLSLAFPIINHSPFNDIQKGESYTIQVAVPFLYFLLSKYNKQRCFSSMIAQLDEIFFSVAINGRGKVRCG